MSLTYNGITLYRLILPLVLPHRFLCYVIRCLHIKDPHAFFKQIPLLISVLPLCPDASPTIEHVLRLI